MDVPLVESTRAWLAPDSAQHDPDFPPAVGSQFRYVIKFRNIGKHPAVHAAFYEERAGDTPHINLRDWNVQKSWSLVFSGVSNETCEGRVPGEKTSVIYPSESLRTYSVDTNYVIPEAVFQKSKILYVEGCMAYTSFGKIRYEGYCFFLHPEPDGVPLDQWKFATCPAGNFSKDKD